MLAIRVLKSGYVFKEENGKKTHLNFKWEGNDFVIDTTNVYLKKVKTSTTEYHPAFYISKDFALEMGWFVEREENTYDLGPNLVMEVHNDTMPVPVDTDFVNEEYWVLKTGKGYAGDTERKIEYLKLSMTCNWRFINLDVAFKNEAGTTKRSLFVYSDVGGSGVVGNQVTDLLREVNYNREGKGSQYFEPLHIQYIQVRKEVLEIIEVQVSETTGKLVKFGAGHTIVTLHFKKT